MSDEELTGKEYSRRAREHIEQRDSGVIADRYEEFARSKANLRD